MLCIECSPTLVPVLPFWPTFSTLCLRFAADIGRDTEAVLIALVVDILPQIVELFLIRSLKSWEEAVELVVVVVDEVRHEGGRLLLLLLLLLPINLARGCSGIAGAPLRSFFAIGSPKGMFTSAYETRDASPPSGRRLVALLRAVSNPVPCARENSKVSSWW